MRSFTVPSRGFGRGRQCIQCRRTLKVGDCGFAQDVTTNGYSYDQKKTLFWHRACLEDLLAEAPLDNGKYQVKFRELKEKAESGDLF